MKWLFKWWLKGVKKANECENADLRVTNQRIHERQFDGGMHFQLVDAQNGKILKVSVPAASSAQQSASSSYSFNPHNGMEEKLWVIPEGENVVEFVTRALVEERIK